MIDREVRPGTGRLVAAGAVAAAVVLALYLPDRDDGSGAALGGVLAFGAVALGLAAVANVRQLPNRSGAERLRLLALSVVLGTALGILNLIANYGIAALDVRIYEQMIEQWARFSAWSVVFAGPMVEEIGYRLLLMGGTAWLLSRLTPDRRVVFFGALAVSAVFLRMGLPYSIACHCTANAIHLLLWPVVF